jgi:hypothetical protein
MLRVRTLTSMGAGLAIVLMAAGGCQESSTPTPTTQIELQVETNLRCDETRGSNITLASQGELEQALVLRTFTTCTPIKDGMNSLGLLVLLPRNKQDDGQHAIKVVTAVSAQSPDKCGPENGYQGCIVVRRRLTYLPEGTTRVPVTLLRECEGVECTEESTCFKAGYCLPDEVVCTKERCVLKEPEDKGFPNDRGSSGAGAGGGGSAGTSGDAGAGGSGSDAGQSGAGGTGGTNASGGDGGGGGQAGASGGMGGGAAGVGGSGQAGTSGGMSGGAGTGGAGAGGAGGGQAGAGAGGSGGGCGPCDTPPSDCYKSEGYCQDGKCQYDAKEAGDACDDSNACTLDDACDGEGNCKGAPKPCITPPGQCLDSAGTCSDGVCYYPPKPAGAPCSDGNACTLNDECDGGGSCHLGTPKVCDPPGQCDQVGTCQSDTGACTYPPMPTGTPCSDGDACTLNDTCNGANVCAPGAPKVCNIPPGQCYQSTGTCAGGVCSYEPKGAGEPCDDGNACTLGDACNGAGACLSGAPMVCDSPPSQCYEAQGACQAGACVYNPKGSGVGCDDGDACTLGDACNGTGACVSGAPKACNSPTQCEQGPGTCQSSTGACTYLPKPAGMSCSDGNACTVGDTCNGSKVCDPGEPKVCNSPTQCEQGPGTCQSSTGACIYPSKPAGQSCNDGNGCSFSDKCDGHGSCVGQDSCPDGVCDCVFFCQCIPGASE